MKKFIIRVINVCVIVAALFGYNKVTLAHEQTDAAAKAEADRQCRFLYRWNLSGNSHRIWRRYYGRSDGHRWQNCRCGNSVCRKRRYCLSDNGKRYHTGDPGCTERGCGHHQWCDFQLHRYQKCNGTGP